MANPRFQKGKFNTGFIAEEFPSGFSGTELSEEIKHRMYSIAAVFAYNRDLRNKTISGQINLARRAGFKETTSFCISIFNENQKINLRLEQTDDGYIISHEKGTFRVRGSCNLGAKWFEGFVDDISMTVQVEQSGSRCRLKYNGCELNVTLVPSRFSDLVELMPVKLAPDMSKYLLSPMPGLLISIAVTEGEHVKAGQELAVVEAMKMETSLNSEQEGKIKSIHVKAGSQIDAKDLLIELE